LIFEAAILKKLRSCEKMKSNFIHVKIINPFICYFYIFNNRGIWSSKKLIIEFVHLADDIDDPR